jgi:acetyltransferase-like isoleucine patch superfamily enzyme
MLGFFLRQKTYKILFRKQGKGVAISTGVSLRQPGKIFLGDGCTIDESVRASVGGKKNAEMRIGKNVFIGSGTILNVRDGSIEISDFTSVGSHCRIATMSHIEIGRYVVIAAYSYIGGGNYRTERTDIPMALQGPESHRGVTIGDDVWIGAHTTVSDGVTIGKGAIIGAMSFVNKDIPDYSVAYGCPAKVHKKRKNTDIPENL